MLIVAQGIPLGQGSPPGGAYLPRQVRERKGGRREMVPAGALPFRFPMPRPFVSRYPPRRLYDRSGPHVPAEAAAVMATPVHLPGGPVALNWRFFPRHGGAPLSPPGRGRPAVLRRLAVESSIPQEVAAAHPSPHFFRSPKRTVPPGTPSPRPVPPGT